MSNNNNETNFNKLINSIQNPLMNLPIIEESKNIEPSNKFQLILESSNFLNNKSPLLFPNLLGKKYNSSKVSKKLRKLNSSNVNYYLFYFDNEIIHIKNVESLQSFSIKIYDWRARAEAEYFQQIIFVCGGINEVYFDTCATLDCNTKSINFSVKMSEKKCSVSLTSTQTRLFCLGGISAKVLNSCEYYDNGISQFRKINPLNNTDCGITSSFDSSKYIYTFGGCYRASYERFDSMNLSGKWEILTLSGTSRRDKGCSLYFNNHKFFIFGGTKTDNSMPYLYNSNTNQFENIELGPQYFNTSFDTSKPIEFKECIYLLQIIGFAKNTIKINSISLDMQFIKIDF